MARIRTVKPDFFRHEGLQDLERSNPGKYPMMVFAGLWGHCDKEGRFEWKPRTLKLDILPFLDFIMEETLDILAAAGQIVRYEANGKTYGFIPSFKEHQRISGKEAQEAAKFPDPSGEASVKQSGSDRDELESQEGKGREEEGKGRECAACPGASLDVSRETFLQTCWALTECEKSPRPFSEMVFGQWWSEGVRVEDLTVIPPILQRQRIADATAIMPPGYYTGAVRDAMRKRTAGASQVDALRSQIDAAWEKIGAA